MQNFDYEIMLATKLAEMLEANKNFKNIKERADKEVKEIIKKYALGKDYFWRAKDYVSKETWFAYTHDYIYSKSDIKRIRIELNKSLIRKDV